MFSENRDKKFQLGSMLFLSRKLYHQLHIFLKNSDGRSNSSWALEIFFGKRFLKGSLIQEEAIQRCFEKKILKPICASIPLTLQLIFLGFT